MPTGRFAAVRVEVWFSPRGAGFSQPGRFCPVKGLPEAERSEPLTGQVRSGSLRARCEERARPVHASLPLRSGAGCRAEPCRGPGQRPGYAWPDSSWQPRFSSLCRKGTLAAGQAPGRGKPKQAGWSLSVTAVTSGRWSPAALPVAFLIPTGRAPRGKATPEGTPTLPLLRAPGRAGFRRRGEQQSRGTGRSAAAAADLVEPLAGDLGGLGERGG